ncbi:MAG TPA: glycosyltransferase family 2 protein [Acidimicrobiales bacterium]|nr:glycosyltransferase family 2 protein [Acidimicrobiales bacterium]
MITGLPSVTVVICAYADRRWHLLVAAIESVMSQSYPPIQIIVVIDHNDALLDRVSASCGAHVDVVPNTEERGLSGARNSGVRHAHGDIVAFLDDDARADRSWLETLVAPYRDQSVIGTGGVARAFWHDRRPAWFPPEFDWVVGCSYRGLPLERAPVRNPIGANMSFRRSAFEIAGSFGSDMGRFGTLPLGCEETEFSIRLSKLAPGTCIIHVPGATVDHFVSADRTTIRYFMRRCVAEGLSKATVSTHVGNTSALASEREYLAHALPVAFLYGLAPGAHGGSYSRSRSGMIVVGLMLTVLGYLLGRLHLDRLANRLITASSRQGRGLNLRT